MLIDGREKRRQRAFIMQHLLKHDEKGTRTRLRAYVAACKATARRDSA